MRLSLFLAVNFAFALDWRIKKAAFNDRNEKYEEIMAKIDSADTFDEIQVRIFYILGSQPELVIKCITLICAPPILIQADEIKFTN